MEGTTFFFNWEVTLMEWIQLHMGAAGAFFAPLLTALGEELVLVAVLGGLYWGYDKEYGKFVGVNLVTALVWNPMIKNIFLRRRPYFDNPSIKCLKPVEADADIYDIAAQGYSFPSGHSTNSADAYGSLALYKKKKWLCVAAVAVPFLVGVSRVMLGVHYPTDVLCGWLLGAGALVVVSVLQKKISDKRILYLLLILTGFPGIFYCASEDYFTSYGLMIGAFAAFLFEERFVRFKNAKQPFRIVLRVLGGVVLFFGLNTILKLPFSAELLDAGTLASHMIRLVRYGVVIFVDLGVYPLLFGAADKLYASFQRP